MILGLGIGDLICWTLVVFAVGYVSGVMTMIKTKKK